MSRQDVLFIAGEIWMAAWFLSIDTSSWVFGFIAFIFTVMVMLEKS